MLLCQLQQGIQRFDNFDSVKLRKEFLVLQHHMKKTIKAMLKTKHSKVYAFFEEYLSFKTT